jgi:hypothetical protein
MRESGSWFIGGIGRARDKRRGNLGNLPSHEAGLVAALYPRKVLLRKLAIYQVI